MVPAQLEETAAQDQLSFDVVEEYLAGGVLDEAEETYGPEERQIELVELTHEQLP